MTTLIPKYDLKNGGATPTGAINRSFNEKLNETVSVKDFGAVGDGVTDDTTAIQAALNSITSSGSVYFPKGQYKITSRLTTTGKTIAYYGDGPYVSELLCAGLNAGIDFYGDTGGDETTTKRLIVENISLQKTYQPTGAESGNIGIYAKWYYTGIIAHIDHIYVTNVSVYSSTANAYWERGLVIEDGGAAYLTNVKLANVGSRGDTGQNTQAALEIRRVLASNCDRFFIVNCYFHRFLRGILLSQSGSVAGGSIEGIYATNIEIVGCYRGIDAPAGANPASDYINGFQLINSHIDFGYIAFNFHRIATSMVSNCFLIQGNNGVTIINGAFFVITNLCDGLLITGNQMILPPAFIGTILTDGVILPSNTDKTRIMQNSFEGLVTCAYLSSAPAVIGSQIAFADDNQFINCTTQYALGIYIKQQAGRATVATGATITFPLPFGANPVVLVNHVGTNTAVQTLPSNPTFTTFVVTHNGVGSIDVNWIAVATN
jgi:hypothetical protein